MDIDVIIPVYKPDEKLYDLLDKLEGQTLKPQNIILMNTEKSYFEKLTWGTNFPEKYPNVSVYHLTKEEFDHGGTRRRAVRLSNAGIFVMMTQDAIPADDKLLESLAEALMSNTTPATAVAYARQLADENCGTLEKSSRLFNYPEASVFKTSKDIDTLGIKTYFCSDVCAAYRRDLYEKVGGFVRRALFNEDMIFAAGAIAMGYGIKYEAQAKVYHSHNYSNAQQFHRNFDLGVSQAMNPQVFAGLKSESEGKKLVKETTKRLKAEGKLSKLPHFYIQCVCKYAGYLLGKHYKSLPEKMVLKCTTNPGFFKKNA